MHHLLRIAFFTIALVLTASIKHTKYWVMREHIAILDFGSQYTQVIARRIRECHVYSRVYPYNTPVAVLQQEGVKGIIFSGGPSSVLSEQAPKPDMSIFEAHLPILGICYGIQLMAELLGGKVAKANTREYGPGTLHIQEECRLLMGVKSPSAVWNSHGDQLVTLPKGYTAVAATENAPFAVIADEERRFYGIQFHPEVAHTAEGMKIIKNFLFNICELKGDWAMKHVLEEETTRIRERVGDKKVVLGLSGGVDSAVAAALIHRAIGQQLVCVLVDNGLLRLNEAAHVAASFRQAFPDIQLRVVDASATFLSALKGQTDPEQKRKIIGRVFIEVFEQAIQDLDDIHFSAQGTLYPDVIESVAIAGNPACVIKSHHNVGGLPEHMRFELLEPLRELFKDEVRSLGESLGVPADILYRHPFPGPGLAVRILGEVTQEKLDLLRQADAIFIHELKAAGLYDFVWQAFAVYLPIQTVGVMGDERTYEHVVALRAVESADAMTADWALLPFDFLQRVSSRITNEVKGFSRVVYDISSKPPATIEWE